MDVWRAVPVLRRIMGFLPGAQRAALLDAEARCREEVGVWVWLELQAAVRNLRGDGARLVWVAPPRPGDPPEATDEWRQQRWLAGYLVRRGGGAAGARGGAVAGAGGADGVGAGVRGGVRVGAAVRGAVSRRSCGDAAGAGRR